MTRQDELLLKHNAPKGIINIIDWLHTPAADAFKAELYDNNGGAPILGFVVTEDEKNQIEAHVAQLKMQAISEIARELADTLFGDVKRASRDDNDAMRDLLGHNGPPLSAN